MKQHNILISNEIPDQWTVLNRSHWLIYDDQPLNDDIPKAEWKYGLERSPPSFRATSF